MTRGRYAPTPSGDLHLGNLRTAIVAWLHARATGGRILLRIDDLDVDRCSVEWEGRQLEDLAWLGLTWDGPPERQSERIDAYRDAADRLAAAGLAYPCFCSRAEIRAASAPHGDEGPIYPGTCRALDPARAAERVAAAAPARAPAQVAVLGGVDAAHGGQYDPIIRG